VLGASAEPDGSFIDDGYYVAVDQVVKIYWLHFMPITHPIGLNRMAGLIMATSFNGLFRHFLLFFFILYNCSALQTEESTSIKWDDDRIMQIFSHKTSNDLFIDPCKAGKMLSIMELDN
jgi:hypothetical protein